MSALLTVSKSTRDHRKECAEAARVAERICLAVVLACATLGAYGSDTESLISSANPEPQDVVAAARALATSGHRADALQMLDQRLSEKRTDSDARTLRGIILSWEGRYDDARRDLEMVLSQHRDHGDALPALINVEMWSDHPERAEELARDALRRDPKNPDLLLARAKALKALKRDREALDEAQHVLLVDPGNQKAAAMKADLGDSLRQWTASFDHSTEWFSDGRTPWNEEQVQLGRQTGIGSVMARFDRADRFSLTSQMVEFDAYPHIRRGMYLYLNAGYSPDANLYPQTRFGGDINQSLGHGYEVSAGIRQLHFGGNIRIYTGAITKYYGNWMVTGRAFLTPDVVGTSRSGQLLIRRYLGSSTDYFSVRIGYGSAPSEITSITDIQILNSQSFAIELNHAIGRRLMVMGHFGYSYEDRIGISGLHHYLADVTGYYRF